MKRLLILLVSAALLTSLNTSFIIKKKTTESDIAGIFKGVETDSGTKAITDDGIKDITSVLVPLRLKEGKYSIKVTRIEQDTYKIDGKNIYIETRYCYEYSYGQEAVIQINSQYGYSLGKITFL